MSISWQDEDEDYEDDWEDEDIMCPNCDAVCDDSDVYRNGLGQEVCIYCDDEDEDDDFPFDNPKPQQESKPMKQFISHIISGDSITVFSNGVHIFPSSHLFYKEICQAVKDGDVNKLTKLVNKKATKEGLEVLDDEILWNGEPLHGTAVTRLFKAKADGFDTTPIINFLKNCQLNPFPQVVAGLYDFLESRSLPLTEDGCFIGYKYCDKDGYWDSYTHSTYQFIPNTHVKATNIENRGKVCDLSGEECSGQGIHVGNWEYSGNMDNVVFVKVNPKDVLSVPVGSGAKKIRVWELDVLGRVDGVEATESVLSSKGEKIPYVKGAELECKYKAEKGKILHLEGTILNVGSTYIELDGGYSSYDDDGEWHNSDKRRLKISNILEVL